MKVFKLILFSLIVFLILGCNPIYVSNAGYHQARLLLARESSAVLLKSKSLSSEVKKKIKLATEVRDFAKTLGLEVGEKYNSVSLYEFPKLWVVTAAPQFSLEPFTWWFPIVGEVPYKGFFEKVNAINEAEKLVAKNLDVSIRTASAFSTLGWFEDPLTTGLLALNELDFVNTIFHELFHSTIWFKNEVEINETLANAFGYVASLEFYKAKDDSKALTIADSIVKRCKFSSQLNQIKDRLETIYKSEVTNAEKIAHKKVEFKQFHELFEKNDADSFDETLRKYSELNNAFFLGLYSYYQDFDQFVNYFDSNNSLKSRIEELKSIQESREYNKVLDFIGSKKAVNVEHDLCLIE